ncbi:acyltransferase family protein [Xenorhabdus bovienii]|uniref:acyltransferase family protein n=1 Tax=Xenorhabdus bovienii TaxID=40576 RepID=UPI0023B2CA63|nr:acyltransferase family protein [Xenorhabdus bovienii]MDE9455616.1 acyltransferase [Xenorhabdus bovienii]MDE9566436.1 acyltransferase [Xenorhabdus bovienii]
MKFRYDINGLRAIAVSGVVIFHFNPTWLSGGFSGVDVFFIISGFLMTSIIFKGFDGGYFNVLNFYISRVNRIIPALTVLCIILLIFGWFYLLPIDYKLLGKHILRSITFFSNSTYAHESGYFDSGSHQKWLLHTWSLSVEWQFYIVYPLILVVFRRYLKINFLKRILLIATILGLAASALITIKWPISAYFLLPSRIWEMLLGGIAYIYPIKMRMSYRRISEIIGLSLIITSFFIFSGETSWPGYFAIIPAIGTYFVLISNVQNDVITNNIVFQTIGRWSYSIYLWHWPIVVFGYYFSISNWWCYGIPLSLLLGGLSYHFIENFQWGKWQNWRSVYRVKPLWGVILLVLISRFVYTTNGVYSRFDADRVEKLSDISKEIIMPDNSNGYCFYSVDSDKWLKVGIQGINCYLGDLNNKNVQTLMFGDSYAGHSEPFWDLFFKHNHMSFQSISTNWCYPSVNTNFTGPKTSPAYEQCLLNRKYLIESIKSRKYNNIILAGSWENVIYNHLDNDIENVVKLADNNGIRIIIMPIPPSYTKNPFYRVEKSILLDQHLDLSDLKKESNEESILEKRLNKYKNVTFLHQNELFNEDGVFIFEGVLVPYTLDGDHMSMIGAKKSYEFFSNMDSYNKLKQLFRNEIN